MAKLNDMNMEELKNEARGHGLSVKGNKGEIIMRIAKHCEMNHIEVDYDPVEVKVTKKYRCDACGTTFESDEATPKCPNCDETENISESKPAKKEKKKKQVYLSAVPAEWDKKKIAAWKKHYRDFFADGGETEEEVAEEMKLWSDEYEAEAAKPKEKKERDNSKRVQIEFNGKSQHICAWARELGMNANTLYNRIYKMGWSVEKAFTTASARAKKDEANDEAAAAANE